MAEGTVGVDGVPLLLRRGAVPAHTGTKPTQIIYTYYKESLLRISLKEKRKGPRPGTCIIWYLANIYYGRVKQKRSFFL